MTTTISERIDEAIARRLRGQLRELNITQTRLGELCGWGTSHVSRRLRGEVPFRTDELEMIRQTTQVNMFYVLTGTLPLPRLDSNQQPFGLRSRLWLPRRTRLANH
jgi:transcriptional regulator with XRE-family HTH domain